VLSQSRRDLVAVSTVVVALSVLALAFVWFFGERVLHRP